LSEKVVALAGAVKESLKFIKYVSVDLSIRKADSSVERSVQLRRIWPAGEAVAVRSTGATGAAAACKGAAAIIAAKINTATTAAADIL
jgi:hypothetical protein